MRVHCHGVLLRILLKEHDIPAFIGGFNNPIPSGIALGIVFSGILLMGWYRQAIFLGLTAAVGNGIETLFGGYVARPRPSPDLIRVDVILKYNSFPSGHVNH